MNANKLRSVMALHGDRDKDLASALGLTPSRFSEKINGKNDFKKGEIIATQKRYNLTSEEVVAIFLSDCV